ncbi:MAG: hypothetical protein JNK72_23270 [Myxococcales bacterium]|nr:hypothetical protein [Myxococcales bacterium]
MTLRTTLGAALACAALGVFALGCGDTRPTFRPQPDTGVTDLGSGDATACADDLQLCAGNCVNVLRDTQNCGDCGQRCGENQMCIQGVCQNECPPNQTRCGKVCINTNTNNDHCGMCGRACAQGLVCAMGRCELECGASLARCEASSAASADAGARDTGVTTPGFVCADTQNDERNCGGCGTACPGGQICEEGRCVAYCPPGQMACTGQCVTLATSRNHCGRCGNACTATQRCTGGTCVELDCPSGTRRCGERCIDVTSDASNCGACGTVCASPSFCLLGTCTTQCPTDRTACGGRCVDVQTDPAACGNCMTACAAGQVCVRGMCALTCPTGSVVCTNRCVETSTDRANCGACGTACGAGELCAGGRCVAACASSQTLCAGTCVDRQTNPAHCGACGLSCGAGFACVAGVCRPFGSTMVPTCAAPSLQCGNRCVDPRTDNLNCGTCGTACAGDRLCENGACVAFCATGQDRCGGTCTDVRSDATNCGACGNRCMTGLSCVDGECRMEATFRINSLDTTNCVSVDHNALTGDDRGPIAASANRVFVTGDGPLFAATTVRFNSSDLMGGAGIMGGYDLMTEDVTTGTVYVLLNAMGASPTSLSGQVITQLATLDDTGALSTARITLSRGVTLGATVGIFGGPNRIVLHTGTRWVQIRLPSGLVEDVGPMTATAPTHSFCESSIWGGVAEFFNSQLHVVYVTNSTTISRYRVSDANISTVGMFTGLSDACNLTVVRATNRWYFHHEGSSQFATGAENLVSCSAALATP